VIGPAEIEEMMAEYAEGRAETGSDPQPGAGKPVWPAPTDLTPPAAPSAALPWWDPFAVGQPQGAE
jgi:hypothetical protein